MDQELGADEHPLLSHSIFETHMHPAGEHMAMALTGGPTCAGDLLYIPPGWAEAKAALSSAVGLTWRLWPAASCKQTLDTLRFVAACGQATAPPRAAFRDVSPRKRAPETPMPLGVEAAMHACLGRLRAAADGPEGRQPVHSGGARCF